MAVIATPIADQVDSTLVASCRLAVEDLARAGPSLPLLAIVRAHFTDPRPVTPDEEVAREAVMRLFGAARKVPRDQRRPLVRQLLRDAGLIE